MHRTFLLVALVSLAAPAVLACSCFPETLAQKLQRNVTVGLFKAGNPSRPFGDIENQGDPITVPLEVEAIYKGDCTLVGTTIVGETGANSALCGATLTPGATYILGLSRGVRFNSCGLIRRVGNDGPSKEETSALQAINQCGTGPCKD